MPRVSPKLNYQVWLNWPFKGELNSTSKSATRSGQKRHSKSFSAKTLLPLSPSNFFIFYVHCMTNAPCCVHSWLIPACCKLLRMGQVPVTSSMAVQWPERRPGNPEVAKAGAGPALQSFGDRFICELSMT